MTCNEFYGKKKEMLKGMVPTRNEIPGSVRNWFKECDIVRVKPHIHVLRTKNTTMIILPGNGCEDQCADIMTAVSEWDWLYRDPYYGL